jgi:hypothetical protein
MNRCYYLAVFLLLSFVFYPEPASPVTCGEAEPALSHRQLLATLRRDGFPTVMLDKVAHLSLKQLGNIKANEASCLTIIIYTADIDNGLGTETHLVARLLVLKNRRYIGMYAIDTLPFGISGNVVNFPGEEKWGNKIVFNKSDPPKQIHLNGEFRELFK